MGRGFNGVLGRLGMPTGDGRTISPGGLVSRDLPLPLSWQRESGEGHGGSTVVARIETLEFHQDMVTYTGHMLDVSDAWEAETLIEAGVIGPSMDLDDITYVVDDNDNIIITSARVAGATLVAIPAFAEVSITLDPLPAPDVSRETSDSGELNDAVYGTEHGDEHWLTASASIHQYKPSQHSNAGNCECGMAEESTVHPHAYAAALKGPGCICSRPETDTIHGPDAALLASVTVSRETLPPLEYFARPETVGPVTVTGDRVSGYLAEWGTCHVGMPGCTTAPASQTDYAHFLRKNQLTSTGETVPVGVLSVGGGHADTRVGLVPALSHYDDVATAVAKVFAGEDEHGIWLSGWILPYADPVKVQQLSDLDVSGDWRQAGQGLELIAVCAVNAPGFPVLRKVHFSLEAGGQQTLIGQFKVQRQEPDPGPDTDSARAAWARANWKGREV